MMQRGFEESPFILALIAFELTPSSSFLSEHRRRGLFEDQESGDFPLATL